MPLRNQMPAKLSARAVYSKQGAMKGPSDKGRGRPRKGQVSPVNVKSPKQAVSKKGRGRPRKPPVSPVKVKSRLLKKNSPKGKKRKTSVNFKAATETLENSSSEADLSSEGEEESDEDNEEDSRNKPLQQNVAGVSQEENELNNEEESSGEEGDVEDVVEEVINDEDDSDNGSQDNLNEINELNGKQQAFVEEEVEDSDEILYSFPDPCSSQSATNVELSNSNEEEFNGAESKTLKKKKKNKAKVHEVQLHNEQMKEKAQRLSISNKRKNTSESNEEAEDLCVEVATFKSKKKKKKLSKAYSSAEDRERSFNSQLAGVPFFSPQNHLTSNRPSMSSYLSSGAPHHPQINSIDSLIRFNKSIPCGNIAADQAFHWLISPTLPADFFLNAFEKLPFTVQRENSQYYKDLFSGNDLNAMLKENNLEYGVHIDVVKYVKGVRIPVSADGRAYYSNVWEDYKQGYSLRIRNPQAYNKNLWRLCTLLQEYFSSTVGCNIYLTPPRAQGFPPHYDDIDAFIVQVEGKKYWKVYAPRFPEEDLARYSSKDFHENEIGDPILQICLNAGEMLYIPRGYIHQAATDGDTHSLHLTFSANQLNTWGDLLLIAVNRAVEKAMLNDVSFRESIPKDYMDYLGSCVADSKAFKRYELMNKVKELAKKAMSYLDVDEAADQHSLKFLQSALPPIFNKIEKNHSIHGNGSYWKNGNIKLKGEIELYTEIQLIKKRVLRLVIADNNPRLYHTLENLRDPKPANGDEPLATYVEFEMEGVPSYLFLLNKYPVFVKVKDLPIDDPDDKISFATSLYENGLIMTKEPLPRYDGDEVDWSCIPDVMSSIKQEQS